MGDKDEERLDDLTKLWIFMTNFVITCAHTYAVCILDTFCTNTLLHVHCIPFDSISTQIIDRSGVVAMNVK